MLIIGRPARPWALGVGLLIAAQLADLGTTLASLDFGGTETNPIVLGIISSGGIQAYILIKLISVVLVVTLVALADRLRRRLPGQLPHRVLQTLFGVLGILVAAQLLAAATNLLVLRGQLGA